MGIALNVWKWNDGILMQSFFLPYLFSAEQKLFKKFCSQMYCKQYQTKSNLASNSQFSYPFTTYTFTKDA